MFSKLRISMAIALKNVRRNMFHTFLSTLGVVIGVAALVTMLCLVDGVEQSIRETISETISLQSITVESERYETLDGIRVERDTIPALTIADVTALADAVDGIASARLENAMSTRLHLAAGSDTVGSHVHGIWRLNNQQPDEELLAGRFLQSDDRANIVVVNKTMAEKFEVSPDTLLDKKIIINSNEFSIIGVVDSEGEAEASVHLPITAMQAIQTEQGLPNLTIEAEKFEEVDRIKNEIEAWLDEEFAAGSEAFSITSTRMFFQQASRGMLFFKIFMGMIMGISVVVGGVGIMNVLLISVKERTKEIGIRKATGARKRDIALQFLSESVTISALGSLLGLIFGFLSAIVLAFIISQWTETSYQAAFTWGTLAVVAVVAFFIGIIFGTYPAMKAARLTPVEAIRHE